MKVVPNAAVAWNRLERSDWVNWWSSPKCRAYYNEQICGRPVSKTSEGCRVRLAETLDGRKLGLGVSVGCGGAEKELALIEDGLVERFELWDIAPNLAERACAAAEQLGIGDRVDYRVGNAFAQTPKEKFDLVYWDHSLHHMADVGAALRWSVETLKPGGYILINDYVGPNRLQYSKREVDLVNDFIARYGLGGPHHTSTIITKLRQWWRDPSEAPQSERIDEAVRTILPGAVMKPIGGVFLNMLGGRVAPHGDDSGLMEPFLAEDAQATANGLYHFAFALWQKPTPAPTA